MSDTDKTKAELVDELARLRRRVRDLERRDRMWRQAEKGHVLVSFIDAKRRYRYVSPGYGVWFGGSASSFLGKHLREVLGPAAYGKIRSHVDAALSGNKVSFEVSLPRPGGGVRHVWASYIPVAGRGGRIRGYMVVATDVSERRKAEAELEIATAALNAQRRVVQSVIDSVGDGVLVADEAGRILFSNPSARRLTGAGRSEGPPERRADPAGVFRADGKTRFPPDELPLARAVRGEASDSVTLFVRNPRVPDGIWLSGTGRPIFTKKGLLRGGVVVFRDVSAQKNRELELERVLSHVPVGLATLDRDMRFRWTNNAMAAMWGRAREAMASKPWPALVPELEARRGLFDRVLNGEELDLSAVRVRGAKGDRFFDLHARPMLGAGGAVAGMLVMARDVTERKALEDGIHQSQKMEAIGRLASGVAHEINNPLAVISMAAQSMVRRIQPEDPLTVPLGEIRREVTRSSELVQNLLMFSRSHKAQEKSELDLNRMVEDVLGLVRARGRMSSVEIEKALAPDLPRVAANKTQLQQVLFNLTNNAIDAMPDGGVLTVSTVRVGGEVEMIVSDTGLGITAEVQERIFEPFYTTKKSGTGLGLYLVLEFAKRHGGGVRVESAPGKGTAFRVRVRVDGGDGKGEGGEG